MLSRRGFLGGAGALAWLSSTVDLAAQDFHAAMPKLWGAWVHQLATMQADVRRREWDLVPLRVDPPAAEDEIGRIEAKHGVTIPAQLREILLLWSARVAFGWSIPALLRPFEGLNLPSSGGLRDCLWSLAHIDAEALDAFKTMRADRAASTDGEEPNTPAMWDNQFAFASLDNGDVLTIDVSLPQGPQPVRYFSGDIEGLHHHAIAPDFVSFVTAYTRLGCAGGDQDDWFRFIAPGGGELSYLDPDGDGARRWRAWLARDPHQRQPDEPPPPVAARTRSDFNLLDAGHDGSAWGIEAALASGAIPDCVDGRLPNRDGLYDITFETALVYAVRRRDLPTIERLLGAGASIDTRLLSVSEAIRYGSVELVRWLLARGARANGWKGDRYWPLHVLLAQPADKREGGDAATVPMLEALLGAGADPDARWDGQRTMLMWARPEAIKVLLEHGADPNLYDYDGDTALHLAKSAEAVRLLAAHGADRDALTRPPSVSAGMSRAPPHTPYQAHLQSGAPDEMRRAILDALLAAGADAAKRDGLGRSSLWYCRSVADAARLVALGLDPRERGPGGRTLLQAIIVWYGSRFAASDGAVSLFKYYQGLGVDINAANRAGTTVLHLAAERCGRDAIVLLLQLGADKTLRDRQGRLPVDRVPPTKPEVRDLLRT